LKREKSFLADKSKNFQHFSPKYPKNKQNFLSLSL
jgi:hypothetical protein